MDRHPLTVNYEGPEAWCPFVPPENYPAACPFCGYDPECEQLAPGELTAICDKAEARGIDLTGWSIAETIRVFRLTPTERDQVARDQAKMLARGRELRRRRERGSA